MPKEPFSTIADAVASLVADRFEQQQVPWLRQAIETPSHSPARDDVEQVARLVDQRLMALGMTRELVADPQGRYADHRVYSMPGVSPDEECVGLVGHVDTVFPRSLGFLEFKRDEDIVRGPGVLDMKSGISAIVFALEALHELDPQRFAQLKVRFICNSDEELGSPSSRQLLETMAAKLCAAMVFEGGRDDDQIITARKGGGMFRIHVYGRAAHAGLAHAKGINAIHGLALLIPRIEALTDYAKGVTLNVGLISGGTAKNTVPDHVACEIDARFLTVEDANLVVAKLEELVADPFAGVSNVPESFSELRVEMEGGVTRPPMQATAASQELRRIYERSAKTSGLKVGEAKLQGGGSDANILAAKGVPCIDGLGPFGKNFHKVEEWSSLDSLCRRTQALARFFVEGLHLVPSRALEHQEQRDLSDHV